MPDEIEGVIELLAEKEVYNIGMRTYYKGKINNTIVVVVFSRWGKVAAATTVTTLINTFNISELIFTGVAGAIDNSLNIGDVVIGKKFFQHDMDARPLMLEFEIPLLGKTYFESETENNEQIQKTIATAIEHKSKDIVSAQELKKFNITGPKVHIGDIASGDHFFSSKQAKENLAEKLPSVVCVEMEGAAVAQVCYEYNIAYTIIRTISDSSDENSSIDFPAFVSMVASKYSKAIIKSLIQ